MFILVKYGNNETLLCNPSCAVINLLHSIKSRAGYGKTNVIVDLSDDTGKYFQSSVYILHLYYFTVSALLRMGRPEWPCEHQVTCW